MNKSRNNSPEFLVGTSTDPSKSLLKLNPFQLAKATVAVTGGKIANVTKLNNGYVLVDTCNEKQSTALQRAEFLDSIPMKISPHNSMNFSTGVIKTPELDSCSPEEIIGNLFAEGVINSCHIMILRHSQTIYTNTYVLTFNNFHIPDHINICYISVPVEKYIPLSLCCAKCQRFGHDFSKCRLQHPTCAKCNESRETKDCPPDAPVKCAHCSLEHPAYSKRCSKWTRKPS